MPGRAYRPGIMLAPEILDEWLDVPCREVGDRTPRDILQRGDSIDVMMLWELMCRMEAEAAYQRA